MRALRWRRARAKRKSAPVRLPDARLSRIRVRKQRNEMGFLCPPLCGRYRRAIRSEIRRRARRCSLPARGNPGRVHGAQRHDLRISAGFRLGLHCGEHRRRELAARFHAAHFRAPRELPPSPIFPAAREAWDQSDTAWLERLAAYGKVAAHGRAAQSVSSRNCARFGGGGVCRRRPSASTDSLGARRRLRSERLPAGARERRGHPLHAFNYAQSCPHRRAGAAAGCGAALSGLACALC